jgi:hypothetical protein
MLGEFEGNTRAGVALLGETAEPGFARGDDGDLGHGEHAVRHEQQEDEDDLDRDLIHDGTLADVPVAQQVRCHVVGA